MTNSWMNEQGEPIMDGAAWRFEQQLDLDSQADYMEDHFYDNDGEAPCDLDEDACDGADRDILADGSEVCSYCGKEWAPGEEPDVDDDFPMSLEYPMEDEWLDGSYEE